MADEGKPGSPNVDILIDGKEIPDGDIISWKVTRSLGSFDTAAITVTNQGDVHSSKYKPEAPLKIDVGSSNKKTVFIGQVGEAGPSSGRAKGAPKSATITGHGMLHMLLTDRQKPKTFQDKTDKQIFEELISAAGLTLEYKGPSITHKHVYQHNQKPLTFILNRAAMIGCHVWGWDKKVFVKEPDFSKTASVKLSTDKPGVLRSFEPNKFTAAALKTVTVRAWDPEKKEVIVHTETASGSKLGAKHASAAAGKGGTPELLISDEPVSSKEHAKALAKAKLLERNLNFITGKAKVAGSGDFDLADVVEIEQDAMGEDDFNGKYYVMGIVHEHVLSKHADEGYTVTLHLARDAQGK